VAGAIPGHDQVKSKTENSTPDHDVSLLNFNHLRTRAGLMIRCQYNMAGWARTLIYNMVLRCACTIKPTLRLDQYSRFCNHMP